MTSPTPTAAAPGGFASALTHRAKAKPAVREYDFRRPTKLSRDNMRVLQVALETFARGVTTSLTGALRTGVRLDLLGIEQISYDEFVQGLDDPVFLTLFSLEPLVGKGALAMPLDTAMAALDHMLGGSGASVQPIRSMTAMEATLTRSLMERWMRELSHAFATLTPLEPELGAFEYNPALAQVTGASETIIKGRFMLRLPHREVEVSLCLPFSSFDQALHQAGSPTLTVREKAARADAARKVTARLEQVPVEVAVRLSPSTVDAVDLLGLEVGSIVPLRHPSAVPLEVTAADVVFARALPWNQRRRLAAQIVSTPATDSKDQTR